MKELERRRDPAPQRMVITTGSWARAALVVALALALFAIRDVILIILTSIVIASAVEPAAKWARNHGVPRIISVLSVYIALAVLFVGLFYFLFVPFLGEASNLAKQLPEYSSKLVNLNDPLAVEDPFLEQGFLDQIQTAIPFDEVVGYVNRLIISFSQGVFSSAANIFGGVVSFVIIIILSFYLAVQEDGVGKFLRIVTPWQHEEYVVNLWKRSQMKIGFWMQGQMLLAVIIMVLTYLGLLIIGVEHALLLAVGAGLLEIIPLFGPIIAAIPAVVIAFTTGGLTTALIVAGLFLIIQQFENHLIYPLVVKKVIGVPPMVSILAILIGGTLAGFIGVVIAVPLAAILMEFVSDLEQRKIEKVSEIMKAQNDSHVE